MRPRNAAVEYAVPFNIASSVPGQTPIQTGPTETDDPQYKFGFRIGAGRTLEDCSNFALSYTYYWNNASDQILGSLASPLYPELLHPAVFDSGNVWFAAKALDQIGFQFVDADYRRFFYRDDYGSADYLMGLRYANLKQMVQADYLGTDRELLTTRSNFDGGGLRFGLEGERHDTAFGFYFYGKSSVSFVGGESRASYVENNQAIIGPANSVDVSTSLHEARLVTILDAELGVGWVSRNGRFRTSCGYLISSWFNAVTLGDYVSSVQTNQYNGSSALGQTSLVFDGITARAEVTW